MVGYLQCIDRPIDDPNKNIDFLQVNSLLYQQNSISYSLLAFLQCDDIPQVINRILGDILKQFRGDRTYIVEIDRKKQVQNCTYESTAKGVSEERDNLQNILWDDSFWWNRQITDRKSIILNTLDDMPLEAQEYRNLLEVQNIKSLMAVPLGVIWVLTWSVHAEAGVILIFSGFLPWPTLLVFVSNYGNQNYRPKKIV